MLCQQAFMSKAFAKLRREVATLTDKRVKLTSQAIGTRALPLLVQLISVLRMGSVTRALLLTHRCATGGSRQMKYMGWEGKFGDAIQEQRRREINRILKVRV
jgi:hypothetical protein